MPEDLLLFLTTEPRKWLFGKLHLCPSNQAQTSPIDQVICTRFMLCLLQSLRFQLTALPGQTKQRAQNTVDSHVFFQTPTHLH